MYLRLTLMTTLTALPAAALAQQTAAQSEAQPVTRAEISARLDSDYADLDGDKDGKVTATEVNSRLRKSAQAQVELFKKERDAAFTRLDSDGNGSISRAEFEAKAPLPTVREPNSKPFLDQFDANKDGAISKDEFRTPTLANFEKLDKNKDGTLSVAEQKAPAPPAKPKQTPDIGR
ncbi:MAG TPA: EF-hand domain-containing protein [Sphingomicrobium sp.]|nr:EF-hand domain-containing protein [Sphingomicrobium sp.]